MVRVPTGKDAETGKRLYHNETVHGPKKHAERLRTKLLREIDVGTYVEHSRITLWEYLDEWLTKDVALTVSPRTLADYRANLERYIRPDLGNRRLQELRLFHIKRTYGAMSARGLSPRTIRAVHAPLNSALRAAVASNLLARNPATGIKLPKLTRPKRRPLSLDEVRRFLAAASGDRLEALWVLLVTTGLRPGEALGLKWSDLVENRLRVQRSLARTASGGWRLAEPKTSRSRRNISLSPSVVSALTRHRIAQAKERLGAGERYEGLDLIFCTSQGAALDQSGIKRRHFHMILKAADLPRIRLYDLRHTCATLMLSADVHPKIVSERLGHASITLTLDTYSHVLRNMQDIPAAQLEDMLFG